MHPAKYWRMPLSFHCIQSRSPKESYCRCRSKNVYLAGQIDGPLLQIAYRDLSHIRKHHPSKQFRQVTPVVRLVLLQCQSSLGYFDASITLALGIAVLPVGNTAALLTRFSENANAPFLLRPRHDARPAEVSQLPMVHRYHPP